MFSRICIFGAGGHGRVLASQIRTRYPSTQVFFGDTKLPKGSLVNGVTVTFNAPEDVQDAHLLVAIGDNTSRGRAHETAIRAGVKMATFIADRHNYFAPIPGAGSMIMAGAVVTSDVTIGTGVLVNTGAIIEHDSSLGDFCHVASGAVLAGGSVLGKNVYIGPGAQVVRQARLIDGCIVEAGATVCADLLEPGIYAGNPAKLVKSHSN